MRLIALAAAAITAVLFTRRKSLKEDAERVKTAASESTHKIGERVRGQSDEEAGKAEAGEAEAEAGDSEAGSAEAGDSQAEAVEAGDAEVPEGSDGSDTRDS